MSRPMSGQEVLDDALMAIAAAKTIEQLRQVQAVVLPLQYGLNLAQAGQVLGISSGWVCRLRNRFIRGEIMADRGKSARGGRRNENFTYEQEAELLEPFLKEAGIGGVLVVGEIKPKLEAALGREMGLSTLYKLLHRHNWRKLVPDKRHPQSDPAAQEAFKKTPRNTRGNPQRLGARRTDPPDVPGDPLWAHQRRAPLLGVKPVRPLCQAMLAHEYTYAYAAVEPLTGILDTLILPHVNTGCMQVFLDEISARHPQDKLVRRNRSRTRIPAPRTTW